MGQNQWYHFGVGAPPILIYLNKDWDVHWGYVILPHGHKTLGSVSFHLQESRCASQSQPIQAKCTKAQVTEELPQVCSPQKPPVDAKGTAWLSHRSSSTVDAERAEPPLQTMVQTTSLKKNRPDNIGRRYKQRIYHGGNPPNQPATKTCAPPLTLLKRRSGTPDFDWVLW